jgi:penicillin-binding protein 2
LWFLILGLLVGCTSAPLTPAFEPTATLPVDASGLPDPRLTARAYLEAWRVESYADMYALLTSLSQDALSQEEFSEHYQGVAAEAALLGPGQGVDYELLSTFTEPETAQVSYRVTMHSELVGDFSRETVMNLKLEAGQWRVQWDDTLILPELAGGNRLSMDYKVPSRANIYDRSGKALVAQSDAVAIGLDTSVIDEGQGSAVLNVVSQMTDGRLQPDSLMPRLEYYMSQGWYLPLTDIAADEFKPFESRLAAYAGVWIQPFKTRYYFDSGASSVAPHVTG